MSILDCFSVRTRTKKKTKEPADFNTLIRTLHFSIDSQEPFRDEQVKSSTHLNLAIESAYEGEDEGCDESSMIKRNLSDFDLSTQEHTNGKGFEFRFSTSLGKHFEGRGERVDEIQSGHVSDPGMGKAVSCASHKLKRSCSNLETRDVLRNLSHRLAPRNSQSFEKLQDLTDIMRNHVDPGSPESVMTYRSADKVMLKKHSSSQILPSRSRRLWWKLFQWSRRNLQKPVTNKDPPTSFAFNQQTGYCFDNLELNGATETWTIGPRKGKIEDQNHQSLCNGVSSLWSQQQLVDLSAESSSSLRRVNEWVKDLQIEPRLSISKVRDANDVDNFFQSSSERIATRTTRQGEPNLTEAILHANSVIRSLNSSSTVAHISGIGLKAIPTVSHLSGLRSVNLSNNFIVQINPGSLPKGLHSLNLSKNKISVIEGVKDLTRLRILNLGYNRITRIGHGLSNCTIIKELYLAGNKISDVEGLHRLSKLMVLDLSFNKISTTKALGQFVANYNSLQALNLLGNPIHSNVSDDQLRKATIGLLPNIVYLNKQAIKEQRPREAATDSIVKAALGNSGWDSRRRASKKTSRIASPSMSVHRSSTSVAHKGRHGSKAPTLRRSSTML